MGIALGCVGMSQSDFEQCTPSEFYAICHAWHERETQLERSRWERMRMECLCMLQPHSKKRLQARDVLEFAWEREVSAPVKVSDAEIQERFARAKARYGLK